MVYLVIDSERKYCKIGYSNNPEQRIRSLKTGCPMPIELHTVIHGGVNLEKQLHAEFSHRRINREWFAYNDEIPERFSALSERDAQNSHRKQELSPYRRISPSAWDSLLVLSKPAYKMIISIVKQCSTADTFSIAPFLASEVQGRALSLTQRKAALDELLDSRLLLKSKTASGKYELSRDYFNDDPRVVKQIPVPRLGTPNGNYKLTPESIGEICRRIEPYRSSLDAYLDSHVILDQYASQRDKWGRYSQYMQNGITPQHIMAYALSNIRNVNRRPMCMLRDLLKHFEITND